MKKILFILLFALTVNKAFSQTITVTYPNGGEMLTANSSAFIFWTDDSQGTVKLEYSTNSGSTWTFIANATSISGTGFYNWTVPAVASNNCLVKVSYVATPNLSDVSDAVFQISSPSIQVTYPNGSEVIGVGDSVTIYWYSPGVNFVDISYSINGGSSYTPIATNIDATLNAYDWNGIPNTPSTNCLIKIQENGNPALFDISDALFEISNPSLVVTYPNGGESFYINTNTYIYWNAVGIPFIDVEYSIDNGANWQLIAANISTNPNYYYWNPIPTTISNQCLVRIKSSTNALLNDVSDGQFSIIQGNISLYYPNGGETIEIGTVYNIYWYSPGITNVNIEYSYDSMFTWQSIASNYSVTNNYDWLTPNTPSTHCFVKIADAGNAANFDVSSADFTLSSANITINSPNGGETFFSGTSQNIYFNKLGVDTVKIEYSIDGGSSWILIDDSASVGTGTSFYYYWVIPNTPSVNTLIRIADYNDAAIFDVSDFPFSIQTGATPYCATNFFPADGVSQFGKNPRVSWWAPSGITLVNGYDVYFGTSANPPQVGYNIQQTNYQLYGLTPNTLYYWKVVPKSINGDAIGCLTNSFTTGGNNQYHMDSIADTLCNGNFYDSGGPQFNYDLSESIIKTFYPGTVGQVLKFSFNSFVTEDYWDNLQFYDGVDINAPLIYNTYFSGIQSPGTIVATNALGAITVRYISNQFNSNIGWDASISCVPVGTGAVTLITPNCGISWIGNTTQAITWNSTNINQVNLEYSIDSGLTWQSIASNILASTGTYNWNVPLPASTHCFVRVSDAANVSINDISNCEFEIQFVPVYIDLSYPNGGETYLVNTNTYIQWQSMFVTSVNIEYSIDAGTTYTTIMSNYSTSDGTNSFYWTVPNTPSNLCLVRISDANNSAVSDASQGAFYIVSPNLEVTNPNGGEVLSGGTYYYVEWIGYIPTSTVKLEYTINNGANWNLIANNVTHYNGSNNYYNWFVPNVASVNCRVRVSQQNNLAVNDESNATFIINANSPVITILQPNGGEVIAGGAVYNISWTSAFTSGHFKLERSTNNGVSWSVINNNVTSSSGYNWYVPNVSQTNCLIRVRDNADTSVVDQSDNTFTINATVPSISLTSPIGGETWLAANYYYITWNSAIINAVNIEFSSNGGTSWSNIVSNVLNTNYYQWLVPNTISSNCKIRVSAAGNASLASQSPASFSISVAAAALHLISPNGGEVYYANTFHPVTWSGSSVGNSIMLEYSTDGGTIWDTIISSFAFVNNSYNWYVPNIISNQYKVRISTPSISDVSDNNFSVISSTVSVGVVSPNGGEYLTQAYWHNITWNRNNVPMVDLNFSSDNGATWNVLADSLNASNYYWLIPTIASTQCLIKVNQTGFPAITDQSDNNFTIGPFATNGNGIVIDSIVSIPFCKEDTFYVYYSASGVYNAGNIFSVQLSDSVGNFNNVTLIGSLSSTATSGYIACIVPATVGNGVAYRIRIQSSDLPSTSNDNGFDITINSPQFDFAANFLIKYLPDGAVTFFVIPAQLSTVTYNWNFGDGGTSTSNNPTHNYTQIGKRDVTCTISDAGGCSITVFKPQYIRIEQLFPSTGLNTNTLENTRCVNFLTADTGIIVLDNGNAMITFDGGNTFTNSITGLIAGQDSLRAASLIGGKWRIAGTNGIIKESTDNGQTWLTMPTPSTERLYGLASYDDTHAFAVGNNGLIMNYDGANWVDQNIGITNRFWHVSVDSTTSTPKAYAVGSGGTIYKYDGTAWIPKISGITGGLFGVSAIAQDIAYAVGGTGLSNGYITKTTDGGTSWNIVLNGVDVTFRSVTGIADTAWACATDGIVYETRDGGSTWTRYSVGDTYENTGIIFKNSRGYVTGTGGHARSFGLAAQPDTSIGIKKIFTPNLFTMAPNPAKDQVIFSTQIISGKSITISIKDIEGKLVDMIVSELPPSGVYKKEYNSSKLKPGIYFVHVNDGVYSFAKKLVIVK